MVDFAQNIYRKTSNSIIMKVIKISKELRRKIRLASIEGETVDETINRLLPNIAPRTKHVGHTNITISDETHSKLKDVQEDGETLTKVIDRLVK